MMAGLNVGGWGKFPGQPQNTMIPKTQPAPESGGINTAPSQPPSMPTTPPISRMGGINVGKGSQMHTLPSTLPGDAFRTYASVNGGQITPPQDMYAPPSNLPTGGGAGTWGPINTSPSPSSSMTRTAPPGMGNPFTMPIPDQQPMNSNPWLERGGFTGGQMPSDVQSGSAGATGFYKPPQSIPNEDSFGQRQRYNRGLRGAYGGKFQNNLTY